MKTIISLIIMFMACTANAKIGELVFAQSEAGEEAQDALPEVQEKLKGWKLCHASSSEAESLAIGSEPETDGLELAPGECFECESCDSETLTNLKVSGEGAVYSVVQFMK